MSLPHEWRLEDGGEDEDGGDELNSSGRGAGPSSSKGMAGSAGLSVRQIKEILDAAGVDYSDCTEKAELQARPPAWPACHPLRPCETHREQAQARRSGAGP